MLDFNREILSAQPINRQINELIEAAEPKGENYRRYLGASVIGSECRRKIQFDWICDPQFPGRIKDIFERGHFFEGVTRQHLIAAGFKFAPVLGEIVADAVEERPNPILKKFRWRPEVRVGSGTDVARFSPKTSKVQCPTSNIEVGGN